MRGLGTACKNVKKLSCQISEVLIFISVLTEKKNVFEKVFQLILRNPPKQHF